jgi:Xaa-Pro aminopeptidase
LGDTAVNALFQSFDAVSDPAACAGRVAALRGRLAEMGLDGFLVPRSDEHQGEYVAPGSERLKWLTGFSGSAGAALVLAGEAHVFVDGRYTLQVREQVDLSIFQVQSLVETPPDRWLGANLAAGSRIGFDPWLHTVAEAARLGSAVQERGGTLVPVDANPVDAVWPDRPAAPRGKVVVHPLAHAGETAKEKLARLATAISEAGAAHAVLTDPSSVAWAFNIRGADVPHTPLVLAFAILSADRLPLLFLDPAKLDIETEAYLTQLADLRAPDALEPELRRLAGDGAAIALDPQLAAERLRLLVEEAGGRIVKAPDPARLPRATKNDAELAGARAAHRRDGAAMAAFLAWLDSRPAGSLDEITVATKLESCRRETGASMQMPLKDISFDTISGAGPNGAIVHYRVSTATNRELRDGELYLIDSGGQYVDGTTDVTRTVAIGAPSGEMRDRFTRVLKGMIGITLLRFPEGTRGMDIDAVARLALWKAGLDYGHGTGHGVGSYLGVHEGPQRIARTGTEKLLPGMIVSNEPGYYRQGAYGIRIENLVLVAPPAGIEGGDLPMLGFETLTLVPIDRRLIVREMLTAEEHAWLDAYHARVAEEIGPLVDGPTRAWLEAATAPL